jgi:ribonuclease G
LTELWRDDAPGERRAGVVEGGIIVEMHIQRDLHWAWGETGDGRIDRKTPSGAYIAADDGSELLVRGKADAPEGARVIFEVTREAIAEPGRVKPPEAKLISALPELQVDRGALWERRMQALGAHTQRQCSVSDGFDVAIAGASQVGDVTISFQRTKAGLVFDVDGIGDPLAINLTAAKEIARLLRLYQVGAMAMIDFIAVDSKAARQAIAEAFDAAAALDSRPFERTAINGYGLMQVVRARPRPSALDHLFGTRIASLSDETQALWLLRDASRSSGFGVRTVTARTPVATLLASPKWRPFRATSERLAGAALEIVADDSLTDYGHVHVAQS